MSASPDHERGTLTASAWRSMQQSEASPKARPPSARHAAVATADRFQANPSELEAGVVEPCNQGFRFARHLLLADDLSVRSTTHTLLSSSKTSIAAKYSTAVPPRCLGPTRSDPVQPSL